MDWLNIILLIAALLTLTIGLRAIITTRDRPLTDEPRRSGMYKLGLGTLFLSLVAGYAGVRFGLFGQPVRLFLNVAGLAVAGVAVVRFGPRRASGRAGAAGDDQLRRKA